MNDYELNLFKELLYESIYLYKYYPNSFKENENEYFKKYIDFIKPLSNKSNKLIDIIKPIDMISNKEVYIYFNNETGKWLYSIISNEDKDLWIESFETYYECYIYCCENKLTIVNLILK